MSSVRSTRQITRTMEMVSTAKIRKALELAEEATPYKEAIASMLSAVVESGTTGDSPLLSEHDEMKSALFVLVASDSGLAGGFNITLEREVESKIAELAARGIKSSVITCGRKPTDYFRFRGIEPVLAFEGISSEPTRDEADEIVSYIIEGYTTGAIDWVTLHYQHARNRVEQDQVMEQILPISTEEMALPNAPRVHEHATPVGEHRTMSYFKFDPSPDEVLGYMMPAYIHTVIFHALLDSAAAEHGARRRAMQAATDNASEIIKTLGREYNRIRQGSITTELNEIVGGASALEEK